VITAGGTIRMPNPIEHHCRWCGTPLESRKKGQKFCCANHRYQWHKAQKISPGKLEEKIREIVSEVVGDIVDGIVDERLVAKVGEELERRGVVVTSVSSEVTVTKIV
jgi:uncharacterized Zn finger protein (UPF0148 family)